MTKINRDKLIEEINDYVENNIGYFHQRRIQGIKKLKLLSVLGRKNPYLFKAKFVLTVEEIIKKLLEASLSSSEETIFGNWLEGFSIFINSKVYNGRKSGIKGIDLEFDKDNTRYIIAIKSGPNWGNSSQIKKTIDDFKTAKKTLRTSNSKLDIIAINGCCYGRDTEPDKGDYFRYCGQSFWEFISGDTKLYTKIIEPLGYKAKEQNEKFMIAYSQLVNRFTKEFTSIFCTNSGKINWEGIIRYNSENRDIRTIKQEFAIDPNIK